MPLNQTKEEEIGSLTEKQFRIMIVKMIQNFESIMELQINSLETRIKKLQEKFNKDLEEIKKSQSIMINPITEIKNTLEGTNSIKVTSTVSGHEKRPVTFPSSVTYPFRIPRRPSSALRLSSALIPFVIAPTTLPLHAHPVPGFWDVASFAVKSP